MHCKAIIDMWEMILATAQARDLSDLKLLRSHIIH